MSDYPVQVKGEFQAQRLEFKHIYDIRTFLPHQVKEVEEWSHKKQKNEKWFVYLDCNTLKLHRWKLHR